MNAPLRVEQGPKLIILDSRANLSDLVIRIKDHTTMFLESRIQEHRINIYQTLDRIADIFQNSVDESLRKMLTEIHDRDKEIWSSTEWEVIRWNDKMWHENNDGNIYKRTGIFPTDILCLPKSTPRIQLPHGIEKPQVAERELRLAHIYGATTSVLSPKLTKAI